MLFNKIKYRVKNKKNKINFLNSNTFKKYIMSIVYSLFLNIPNPLIFNANNLINFIIIFYEFLN